MNNEHYYGFRPHIGNPAKGGRPSPPTVAKTVASGYQAQDDASGFSVDLNVGDPVKLVSDGSIALANTTEAVFGIIVAFGYYYNGSKMVPTNYLPGGSTWTKEWQKPKVYVVPINACQWEIDVDEAVTATTEATYRALVGQNVTHTCVGVSATKKADPRLDISSAATTAGLVFRIEGISPSAQNKDFSGTNVKLLVSANLSQDAGQAATTIAGV